MDDQINNNSQGNPQDETNEPELEHILKARYANDAEHFLVFAEILGPSFQAGWHQLSKDGWTVVFSPYSSAKYYKVFEITSTPEDWLNSIDSLNRLLLAYFINDFSPRKIYGFELPNNLEQTVFIGLTTVFGAPQIEQIRADHRTKLEFYERKSKLSFDMSGIIFNGMSSDPNLQIDDSLIEKWYDIFREKVLFTSVNLLEESFILINRQWNSLSFFNYMDLSMGIILLVSALENLFTYKQENFADIKFKFGVVGSLYYQKNVTTEFLKKFDGNLLGGKFSRTQFQQILFALYDLRSDIAHGSYSKILKGKNWKRLFGLLKVGYDDSLNKAILSKHIALALGLLQKHILALIIQSNIDLLKGATIIDEAGITHVHKLHTHHSRHLIRR